jgi:hypothetical protein
MRPQNAHIFDATAKGTHASQSDCDIMWERMIERIDCYIISYPHEKALQPYGSQSRSSDRPARGQPGLWPGPWPARCRMRPPAGPTLLSPPRLCGSCPTRPAAPTVPARLMSPPPFFFSSRLAWAVPFRGHGRLPVQARRPCPPPRHPRQVARQRRTPPRAPPPPRLTLAPPPGTRPPPPARGSTRPPPPPRAGGRGA